MIRSYFCYVLSKEISCNVFVPSTEMFSSMKAHGRFIKYVYNVLNISYIMCSLQYRKYKQDMCACALK